MILRNVSIHNNPLYLRLIIDIVIQSDYMIDKWIYPSKSAPKRYI